jgi:hypothetical protein
LSEPAVLLRELESLRSRRSNTLTALFSPNKQRRFDRPYFNEAESRN